MRIRDRLTALEEMCVKTTRKFDPLQHDYYGGLWYGTKTVYIDKEVQRLQKQVEMLLAYLKLEEYTPDSTTVLRKIPKGGKS